MKNSDKFRDLESGNYDNKINSNSNSGRLIKDFS